MNQGDFTIADLLGQGTSLLTHEEVEVAKGAIPRFVTRYIEYARSRTSAPMLYHLAIVLLLLSRAASRHIDLPFVHRKVFANIWVLLLGFTRLYKKTTSIDLGLDILLAAIPDSTYSEDHSPEALIEEMEAKPQGALVRDEFSGFMANMNRSYSEGHKELMMRLYDCPDRYHRKLRQKDFNLDRVYLSLLSGTTTSRFLSKLSPDDWENGFLARFLFVLPEERAEYRDARFIDEKHLQERNQLVDQLKRIHEVVSKRGREMFMTEEALARYNQYCRDLEDEVQNDENSIELAGSYSELETYAAKIALLLGVAKGVEKEELEKIAKPTLSLQTVLAALMLTEVFKTQVERLLMTQREQVDRKAIKRLETAILKRPGISYRELLQNSNMPAENLGRILGVMESEGLVTEKSRRYYHC